MTARRSTIRGLLQDGAAHLFPGYFALVMATGALSIAGHLPGFGWLAWPLLAAATIGPERSPTPE